MKQPELDRRTLMGATAAVSATALVQSWMAPAQASVTPDRVLRMRTNRTIVSTDPGYMVGGMETVLQYACLAQLATLNEGPDWSWSPSEFVAHVEQVDARTIVFELKAGIQWHDGATHEVISELDAEDVKFSLERIKESEWKDKAAALDHVEVTGSHSGVIHLNQPFAPVWYTWLASGTGTILCRKAVEASGGKYDGMFGFYIGPFRIKDWSPKQFYELEANPFWTGTPAGINTVRFIVIEDEKTAEIAYEAGDVDFTHISTDTLARYQSDGAPDSTVLEVYPGLLWTWMGINTDHPKLRDVRVRKAIQRAIDVDTILEAAYAGVAPKSHGIVPPGVLGHRTTSHYSYAPDEARSLIAEAGAEGLQLELKTINRTDRMAAATVIQANLADVGIELDVIPLDPGPFWNLGLESSGDDWKDLQLWIMRYGDAPDPSQMAQWYVEAQVGVWNWERWKDAEFDALFLEGLGETDEGRREEIYLRMQDIMEDTGAYVWITHEPVGIIHREELSPSIRPNGWQFYMQRFAWT